MIRIPSPNLERIARDEHVSVTGANAETILTALRRALSACGRDAARPASSRLASPASVTAHDARRRATPSAASAVPTSSVTITPAASAPQASRGLTPPAFPGEWHERWHRLAPKIVVDKPRRPQEQMDVDVQWSREVAAGERPATIRFWQWASPAVVVGRFQSIPDEVHEDVAAKEGFTVVRRCTGGGAMFIEPGNTITYSLYAPRWFAADLDIEESYRLCDMWLIAALRGLGLDVASPSQRHRLQPWQDRRRGPAQVPAHRLRPRFDTPPRDARLRYRCREDDPRAEHLRREDVRQGREMAVKRVDPMRAQTGLSRDG